MARPRKDQEDQAVQRIKEAFWTLLEENDLNAITIRMITKQAKCNRGTFYYHYESMDALIKAIIQEEIMHSGLPHAVFSWLCQEDDSILNQRFTMCVNRFGLMMHRAGQERVDTQVKEIVINLWREILCAEGENLTVEARLIIEFSVSGIIGLIGYLYREGMLGQDGVSTQPFGLLHESTRDIMTRLSKAQGISVPELRERICNRLQTDFQTKELK